MQETRSWAPPKHLIGERIAIHAAKRKLTKAELRELPSMIHHDISARYGHFWEEDVPYGAVVATAELGGACEIKGPLLTPERGLLGHHCYTNEPCRVLQRHIRRLFRWQNYLVVERHREVPRACTRRRQAGLLGLEGILIMRKHITQLGKFVRPTRKEGQSFEEWEKELIHRIAAKREMWRWWRRAKCS